MNPTLPAPPLKRLTFALPVNTSSPVPPMTFSMLASVSLPTSAPPTAVPAPRSTVTAFVAAVRVFSRRFVKSFPVLSEIFEIEAELSVHALELNLPLAEMQTPYYARPQGSRSKLNT